MKNKTKSKRKISKKKKSKAGKGGTEGAPTIIRLFSYEVSFDPIEDEETSEIPRELGNELNKLHSLIQERPQQTIDRLEELGKEFPNIPKISNYLSVAYIAIGEISKAKKIIVQNYETYPQYLFAKTSYAELCLQKGEPDKIPRIFDNKFDLKLLYPERDVFHVSEALSFFGVMGLYFCKIGELDNAENAYKILKELGPEDPYTLRLVGKLAQAGFKEALKGIFNTK